MEGAFSRCIQLPVAGLTIRSGPFVTMPRNRKCIVERIIEALCDKLIVLLARTFSRERSECLLYSEKLSLPMERRATVSAISCRPENFGFYHEE